MIDFLYDHDKITTTDELKISVADLRDLINCVNMNPENEVVFTELNVILDGVKRKNRMGFEVFGIKNSSVL